ncbi:MAG: peptidylprolyl isomerase [Sedimentisphaerales bacterium]
MKTIVSISLVLVILLSTAAFAAKPKKPAAESKNAVAEANKPVEEPKAPVSESTAAPALSLPNGPALSPAEGVEAKDANVIVTVNGTSITEGQIEDILNPRMQQMAGRVPENMVPQYRQQIRKRIIEQLVIEQLITEDEKKNNIDVNQAELDQQINKQIASQNLTLDEFKALLKAYGTTFGEYQKNMTKKLMFEKLMDTKFADKMQPPTDQQIKAYYDENIQQFNKPESIHAKHILIAPAQDANDPNKAKAEAKAKAEGLLKKLKAGADFNDLAKQYSACPSSKQGGDLGIQAKGNLVPEFEKAAYALKPGQISDVVETSFGFHIIKLIEHIDAGTVSFEKSKDEIKQTLADKQREQVMMDYIQKIRTGADIKYTNEAADKLETEIPGTKPTPSRKATENPPSSDTNKPASKDTGESKKE